MQLTTYEPNWNDPRVQSKVKSVLSWCNLMLHHERPAQIHSNVIREVFGSNQKSSLNIYLKANLLIQSGTYAVGTSSYSYLLNQKGYDKLSALVDNKHIAYVDHFFSPIEKKHESELTNLSFNYNMKADRYWHPLQNIRREKKAEFWQKHGLPFDYDIDACAPTILLGLAEQLGLNHLVGKPIQDYLNNKDDFRNRLATKLDIPYQDAKMLINSLFNGARLAANPYCRAFQVLGSKDKMELLQDDAEVRMLRMAIKAIWLRISNRSKSDVSDSKGKWAFYFHWERIVLDVIRVELLKQGVKSFTEHDGFRTDTQVDTTVIEEMILNTTKLKIRIKKKIAEI